MDWNLSIFSSRKEITSFKSFSEIVNKINQSNFGKYSSDLMKNNPYLKRWWIIPRNKYFNIYLHHFMKSDDDRALHDHMYWNVSIIFKGSYLEHTPKGIYKRKTLSLVGRLAKSAHRIELNNGPCWTLFITGPRIREWGFHCPNGWRHWKQFVSMDSPGEVGPGCD